MPRLDASTIRVHRIGAGPPVILLHGLGQTRGIWDGLATLAARFELISYDLPGHGETPAPDGPFEIDDLAGQLGAVMTGLGIERAHLIGHSLGGMAAQVFASADPERVERLVLCDTTPGFSDGMRDELLIMRGSGLAHAAMARADLMDLTEEIYAPALILCAAGADLAMRDGADFLARSMPRGELAYVPDTMADVVTERPDWVSRVVLDFLTR